MPIILILVGTNPHEQVEGHLAARVALPIDKTDVEVVRITGREPIRLKQYIQDYRERWEMAV